MAIILTPCAGKCSTVFGDSVCRGCRRFSHEVIDWNQYSATEAQLIWLRLDQQIDQIILPLVSTTDLDAVKDFLRARQLRIPSAASTGRVLYEALRVCYRAPECLAEAHLILSADVSTTWQTVERRLYALAVASFELAWMRAASFGALS